MLSEQDEKEFRQWQHTKHQTALDHAFNEIEDLLAATRDYTITMPARAFKTLAKALVLLKHEVTKNESVT